MTLPQIIVDLLTLLFDMAVPAAICTMVLAGIALRQEGGVKLPGGRQVPAMGSVVGNSLDASAVALLVCGAGYRHACTRRRHQQFVDRELADGLQRFCFERRGCPVDSRARRFLRAESGARLRPEGYSPLGPSSPPFFCCPASGTVPAFPELEQRVTVRNHGHADRCLELSRWDDPAGSSRMAIVGAIFNYARHRPFMPAGWIGSCVLECFGHLEAGPGHGRLMRMGGDPVNLSNGLLNLTNWLGNVIMPTMAGLFAAAAIYRFSKAHPYSHLGYAALASLMCSGLLRAMESFSKPSILEQSRPLLDLSPDTCGLGRERSAAAVRGRPGSACGGALRGVARTYDDWRGLGAQTWSRRCAVSDCRDCLRLGEFWIQHGTAGVPLGRSLGDAIAVTPVNRNLQTRVTFMLLGIGGPVHRAWRGSLMNVVGHFVGGEGRRHANEHCPPIRSATA